jgi:EpsI family protein
MIERRNLLIGVTCVAGAAAAYALTPRRRLSLLGGAKLADIIPAKLDGWSSTDVTDLVAPKTEGSLAARLYNQTVERVYRRDDDGFEVMMLVAYGDTQSNELQLHRPESCYPAFGFALSRDSAFDLPIDSKTSIPARRLVADAPSRRENIIYWVRLGEFLPKDDSEQRTDRLKAAMHGYVADGVLARFSALADDPEQAWTAAGQCVSALIKSMAPAKRNVLIGNALADSLRAGGV